MSRYDSFLRMLQPDDEGWGSRAVEPGELAFVTKEDAIEMLTAFAKGAISYAQLVDWANLVLFNDAFEIDDDDLRDCLDCIEESDEPGHSLSKTVAVKMIESLS